MSAERYSTTLGTHIILYTMGVCEGVMVCRCEGVEAYPLAVSVGARMEDVDPPTLSATPHLQQRRRRTELNTLHSLQGTYGVF